MNVLSGSWHAVARCQQFHPTLIPSVPFLTSTDRYVVFGVPMDSLTAGALTPGTALSQFLELGRLLAGQYKSWKPRRTVVLAAWDAQQFGHIGATEYIEVSLVRQTSFDLRHENSQLAG